MKFHQCFLLSAILLIGLSYAQNNKTENTIVGIEEPPLHSSNDSELYDELQNDTKADLRNKTIEKENRNLKKKIIKGECYSKQNCFGVEFQEEVSDDNLSCCDSSGVEFDEINSSSQIGYCCNNGTLLRLSSRSKCITVAILTVSLISCLMAMGFTIFRLNARYEPKNDHGKIGGGLGNLSLATEKYASKNFVSLPVEKPYVSCPLFEESANETSEEETMTSHFKSANHNQEPNRLVFEMIQEDFEEKLKEEEKLLATETRYYSNRDKNFANSTLKFVNENDMTLTSGRSMDGGFGDSFRPITNNIANINIENGAEKEA